MALERRTFVGLLGAAMARWAAAARAEPAIPTVGVLMGLANDHEAQIRSEAFETGLRSQGWSIGTNLRLAYRFANGDETRMQALAAELVAMNCACILGQSTPVAAALQRATRTIPIVFVAVTDPIGSGFVASMAHPGGNITGFTIVQATIAGKYLSMLKELSPGISHAALMYNPVSVPFARSFYTPAFLSAAAKLGVQPVVTEVGSSADVEEAMRRLAAAPGGALVTVPDNFISLQRRLLIGLAANFGIPAIYPYRYFAEAGGLVSYGMDAVNSFARAADYVSRILRGAKPADLPVQEPTKFELVINMKAAAALGLTVPRILLAGADAVIQ
ncbi:MAG TPA: ABC transporter substrate-binding protein [Xanthobacteraceae bacterium]|nr:ABC transporter substrate-binding protein [Xanthobacteraceae bacterium]